MTPPRERLDETIDRVAAGMTLVAADPTLPGRITEQLTRQPRLAFGSRLAIGAAAATAAAMLAAWMINAPASPIDRARSEDAVAVSVPSPEIAPAALVPTPDRVVRVAAPAQGANAIEPLAEFRQIDALPSLATLAVDDLNTDLLTIAPVDVAPLDLDDLVIGDVSGRDEPKE